MTKKHTYDMGMIGNCSFLALIGKDTNVDWMCLPRFDSSFVFGKLLGGEEKGGKFSISPCTDNYESTQRYTDNSNVLETIIDTGETSYKVTDFAPRFFQHERYYRPLMLVRKIEPLKGFPRVKVDCSPVKDYGAEKLTRERGSSHIRYNGLHETLRLSTDIPLNYILEGSEFVLNKTHYMILSYGVPLEGPLMETAENFLFKTLKYWQKWVKSTSIGSLYQTEVIRSSLALKICQYEDTGAFIAAPTTSLPEAPGSGRNWDYRFCWMRDTFYILNAFNNVGHFEEMEKYSSYLTNIPIPDKKRIQPLYNIVGENKLTEIELDLPGYLGNSPVRKGNDAYTHIQNDVYGQILLAILPLYVDDRYKDNPAANSDQLLSTILEKMEMTIDEEDAGIWEFRNKADQHAYTNLFQWAGSKAAVKLAKVLQNPELEKRASILEHKAKAHIESCFEPHLNAYGQGVNNRHMDASTLQLIMMNYLPHNSDIAKDHLKALEKELKVGKGLFYRYLAEDDFGKPKTTFLICGFWYAEALACVGRLDDAMEAFEELVSYSNHLGLLSEDINAADGSMWGNFPQAYSHVGLVNAASRINNLLNKPKFL
tara:strand:+ start:2332 stop:4119 length:1788 start_codon:yes stop_codon:yes gene_type:complete